MKNNERDLVRKVNFFRAEVSTFKAKNIVLHDQKADEAKVLHVQVRFDVNCYILKLETKYVLIFVK